MDINQLRRQRPELANLDDETVVRAIQLEYPEVPPERIAADLGVKFAAPPPESRTLGGTLKDVGISFLSGAVGVPEAAVGLADLVSGGAAGRGLESVGFRPREAKQILQENYSEPQRAAFRAVESADGFMGKLGAAVTNPSTIAHSVIESLPVMGAGGVLGRAVAGLGLGAGTAAAVGEGTAMAGSAAEQIRQQTPGGGLSGEQAGLALATGVGGAAFAMLGAKIAKSLGINDIDTMIVAGKANAEAGKGLVRRVLEGAFAEGGLEELPQSIMEQVLQNKALGKPLEEGVDQAAVMGLLAGAAMGGGANVMAGKPNAGADSAPKAAPGAAQNLSTPGAQVAAPAMLGRDPSAGQMVVFPDGTTGYRSDIENYVAGLPEDQQMAMRTKLLGMAPQPAGPIERAAAQAGAGSAAPAANPEALNEAIKALIEENKKTAPSPQEQQERELRLAEQSFSPPAQEEDPQALRDEAVYNEVMADKPVITPGTVDEGAHESHSSPMNDKSATPAQILGDNAPLGHTTFRGRDVSVENADGSERIDLENDPPKWRTKMRGVHYTRILGTTGADGDHLDMFLRAGAPKDYDGPMYVVDQVNQADGSWDEHKIMGGFKNRGAAVNAYKAHYSPGWKMGRVTEMSAAQFDEWLKTGDHTKPASPKGPLNQEAKDASAATQAPADAGRADLSGAADPIIPTGNGADRPGPVAPTDAAGAANIAENAGDVADASDQAQLAVGVANAAPTQPQEGEAAATTAVAQAPTAGPAATTGAAASVETDGLKKGKTLQERRKEGKAKKAAAEKGPAPQEPTPTPAPKAAPGTSLSAKAETAESAKSGTADGLSKMLGKAAKRMAMESEGQGILDDMSEANESPRDVAEKFWRETYFKLPPDAQERFKKMARNHAGEDILTSKDHAGDVFDLPTSAEHLEGTERGFVALMRDGNRRFEAAPHEAAAQKAITSAPEPATAPAKPDGDAVVASQPVEAPEARRQDGATTDPMASRKDVVGNNEGGRSADDARKGAPTPDTSLALQGSPGAGMQERPAVRAVSGSLVEPAQSEGGAGSGRDFTSFLEQRKDFENVTQWAKHIRRQAYAAGDIDLADWAAGIRDQHLADKAAKTQTEKDASHWSPKKFRLVAHRNNGARDEFAVRSITADRVEGGREGDGRRTMELRVETESESGFSVHVYMQERDYFDRKSFGDMPVSAEGPHVSAGRAAYSHYTLESIDDNENESPAPNSDAAPVETTSAAPAKSEAPMFSQSQSGGSFAAEVMNELAAMDDAFRWPPSEATSLAGVFADINPTIKEIGDTTREDEKQESGAEKRTLYRTAAGKDVYVYEKGKEVWIDVSRLESGQAGDSIYHAVATYAHNAGKVFVGDPAGLSEDAIVRRTYHMLGSALRFGSSDHFKPAPEQLKGLPDKGIAPLEWRGNDADKLESLVHTFTETTFDQNPKLRDYRYDFDKRSFVGPDGNAVTRDQLLLGMQPRSGAEAGGNRRTPAASVFLASLARAPSSQRPGLLALAHGRPAQLLGKLGGPLFRQTSLAPATPAAVGRLQQTADSVMEKFARKMEVIAVSSVASPAVPKPVRDEAKKLILAGGEIPSAVLYEGRIYLFADRTYSDRQAAESILHEIAHFGLRGNFGKDLDAILRQIAQARPAEVAAMIRKNGFQPNEKLRAAEEILAEMAQKDPALPFVKRAIAAIRTWLRNNLPSLFGKLALTDDEIIRSVLTPAREFVQTGQKKAAPGASFGFNQSKRTIEVSGKRYPIEDSKGRLVGRDFAEQSRFWKWFADSKTVDSEGKPLTLYHGTPDGDIEQFKTEHGAFFTSKPDLAEQYTMRRGAWLSRTDSGAIYPAYLSMKNPLVIDADGKRNDNIPVPWAEWKPKVFGNLPKGAVSVMDALDYAREHGHDGLIIKNVVDTADTTDKTKSDVYAALRPEQIKSAIGATKYDPTSPNIMFNQSAGLNSVRDVWPQARDMVHEFGNTPGKLNWWQKTFGTPYDLAQRNPKFKAVYDGVQNFLHDVSQHATEAADLAPSIIPKLESWRDLLPKAMGGSGKSPLSPQDNKDVGRAVWEGTLTWTRDDKGRPVKMASVEAEAEKLDAPEKAQRLLRGGHVQERVLHMWNALPIEQYEAIVNGSYAKHILAPGIVWSDAELKSMFGLDARQIGLYREFHAATAKSLNDMAKSDMLRFAGKDGEGVREQVKAAPGASLAAEILRDHLLELAELIPERSAVLTDTANRIIDKSDKIEQLLKRGYAPLSRFGRYTVDVVDADGERVYFGLFEGRMEARHMAAKLAEQFPGATIRRGTTSEEEHKMFAGMTPETAELFGEMLGLEADGTGASNIAFQKWLKNAKASRSAMKRLIERKGIAGYSEDMGRVLAGFVYSNSRQTAQNLHASDIKDKVQGISQGEGELKDAAIRLMKYVQEPQEEAVALRGLLFAQYLGGSIASMLVNMTQPFQVTMPYLSQYGGIKQSAGMMKGAVADAWKPKLEAGLQEAIQRAVEQGIVAPQEVHQLMAQAAGRGGLKAGDGTLTGNALAMGNNALARLVLAWGKPFAMAELFNRRVTFIAAYRTAVKQGIAKPAEFAARAVDATQFVYNKGNKPEWGRGAVGSVLFTFKNYSISYLELAHRMYTTGGPEGKKAALFMLAMLMLMGGAGGLPFVDDVSDLIDGAGQRMGYNLRIRHERDKLLRDTFGDALGGFLDKGVSGLPGVPIDVAGRFGMGNLIPGTGLLTKKTDHTRDVTEIAGPAGEFATRMFQGANQAAEGNLLKAGLTVSPKAASNLAKAAEMASMGFYTDANGKKVVDTDGYDAFVKGIGFQPNAVAKVQQASRDVQQLVAVARMKETEIADRWAMAVFQKDSAAAQSAKEEVQRWNANNPSSPIKISYSQITKRVREMNKPKGQRIADSAPKEIREEVRRELRGARP